MNVLQCLQCGAPLNVAPGQRFVTCEFCGSTIDVGARAVVPRSGPTNAGGPATAREPYPPSPYPPNLTGASRSGAAVALVVGAVVLALAVLGAAVAALFFVSVPSSRTVHSGPVGAPTAGGTRAPTGPSLPPAKANYLGDAGGVSAQLKAKFGPRLLVKRLVVYPEYVIFTAQNPAKPDDLDTYTLRNGSIDEGRAEKFVGDRRQLETELFSIDEIPFGSLPGLGRDTLGRFQAAGVSEGKLTHIIIERENFGRGPGVIVRPYVSSERRGGGYVEYDVRGSVKRMIGPS